MEHMAGKAIDLALGYLGRDDVESMKSLKRSRNILRSQMMDIEEEVKNKEMSCKKKRKTEVENWLKEVNNWMQEYDELEARVNNSRIKSIEDSVGKMQCRANQLIEHRKNFKGLVRDDFDNDGVPCLPTRLFGNKIMEKIWPCLVADDISSIGIYGMGGVGKTTLAKHIKSELQKENYRVYWVTVTQDFSVTSLQDKIANVLRIELSKEDEESMRADILRKTFKEKEKSVLILDDVWEEFSLEEVGIAIGPSKCRLILTTRSSQVCDQMDCEEKFQVPSLDKDESWGLFKHMLGRATILSEEVEKIAESVANMCAGLPLGIVTTARSMRRVTDIHDWNTALEKLKSCSRRYREMEDKVFRILELSFNRLDEYERPCFLHCCLYSEDHGIEREKLIDLFIGAELIPRAASQRSFGHKILNDLVKACLLEESETWNGKEGVKMHDLVRDMALRITSGNSKITEQVPRFLVKVGNNLLLENEELKDDPAAVSLIPSSFGFLKIPPLMSPNCPSLSTLIINHARITEIPDSFFQDMRGLKVLNLNWCRMLKLLPNCISDLENLTALLLEGLSEVKSIPSLGKLWKLRILNLFYTDVDIPQGLEELVNLERLYMNGSSSDGWRAVLPEGTFCKLHRLHHLVLPAAVHISDLRVLSDLQLYVGGLTHDQFSKFEWWPTHYKIVVFPLDAKKPFDNFLRGYWDLDEVMRCADFGSRKSAKWENLLKFQMYNFQKGLDMILPQENLHWLDLSSCSGFFHRLIDRSKDLCHLILRNSEELKFVLNLSSPDETSNFEGVLRNLRTLKLVGLPNLVGLIYIGRESGGSLVPPGTFSSLEELEIEDCGGLKKLFSVQLVKQCLQNLKDLVVCECYEVEEIVANNDDHDLSGGGGGGAIISRPSSSGHIASTSQEILLPKLQKLKLLDLPKLENVCSPTIKIGGEEPITFELYDCPDLKRLPSFSSSVKNPSYIWGSNEWWNSLEWDNPSDKDAVQPFFNYERS